jgi:uncharacterized protein DUF4395
VKSPTRCPYDNERTSAPARRERGSSTSQIATCSCSCLAFRLPPGRALIAQAFEHGRLRLGLRFNGAAPAARAQKLEFAGSSERTLKVSETATTAVPPVVDHGAVSSTGLGFGFGQRISGIVVDGIEVRAGVFNENEVRAAAGITMVIGAVAFCFAYFDHQYIPLRSAASFFFVEFLIRVTVGLQYSPVGLLAKAMMRGQAPNWVSAKPKRFAWTLGLGMALAMTVVTNVGIHGWLPRSMCLTCLTLMWMESALGLCLGCKIYALLMRRGWAEKDPEIELCAGGVCAVPQRGTTAPDFVGEHR